MTDPKSNAYATNVKDPVHTNPRGQVERILARKVARELTMEEVTKIAGGARPRISYVAGGYPSDFC